MEILQQWYQAKYNSHSIREWDDNTIDELLIGYYFDLFKEKPNEVYRNQDGEIQFNSGGADPLYDLWEAKAARGEEVDLWEAYKPEEKEKILQRLEKAKKGKAGMIGAK